MESFDSYVGGGEDLQQGASSARPFDADGYMGFDPRLPSQRFDSFSMQEEGFGGEDPYISNQSRDLGEEEDEEGEDAFSAVKRGSSNGGFDVPPAFPSTFEDDLVDGQHSPAVSSPFGQSFESRLHSEFTPADDFSPSVDSNGKGFGPLDEGFGHDEVDSLYGYPPPGGSLNGAVLPPLEEMQPEEGFVLREWKRQNAIRLEEKARLEREKLSQIIDAADAYKDEFYEKRRTHCDTNKKNNRDKEKVFLENLVNFHATAEKHYWKAVGELVPHELPSMESRSRGNKDKKKPSVVINHGPKPGKSTDLTRMRQVLVKLKHNPPAHMKAPPPPPPAAVPAAEGSDAKPTSGAAAAAAAAAVPAPLQKQGSIPVVAAA